MNYTNDDFFNVPQVERQTSEGEVRFPILYFDAAAIYFYYLVPYDVVEEKMAGTKLKPFRTPNNLALAGLAFYDYKDTSIGPYKEAALAFLAYPENEEQSCVIKDFLMNQSRQRTNGLYIQHLPVTTKEANAAGREIWGYPKFTTDIDFSLDKFLMLRNFEGGVKDPETGNDIYHISAQSGAGLPVPGYDLNLYSNLNGKLLKTNVDVGNSLHSCPLNLSKITVDSPSHPMGKDILDLGLDKLNPFLVQHTFELKTRLHLGVEV